VVLAAAGDHVITAQDALLNSIQGDQVITDHVIAAQEAFLKRHATKIENFNKEQGEMEKAEITKVGPKHQLSQK
jgi:hypothetical protein